MRKLALMMLFMSLLFTLFPGIGQAETPAVIPKLYLNGEQLQSEVEPQIVEGNTIVPIRVVSENIGYEVDWDQASKLVTIHNGNDEIILQIDDSSALVNQMPVQLDVPAINRNGTTLIPLRFVGEQLGLEVEWDQASKSVFLTKEEPGASDEPVAEEEPPASNDSEADEAAGDIITSVAIDDAGDIIVGYDGTIEPDKPFLLDNPKRLVIDIPNVGFADSEQFAAADKTLYATEHAYMNAVRYSLFSNDPVTVRLVIDLNADAEAELEMGDGELRIRLAEPSPDDENSNHSSDNPDAWLPDSDLPYVVVIDAGHGGTDPGAKGANGRWESELNLSISLKVKELLDQEEHITVLLSRPDDTYVTLPGRVEFAETNNADLFVSLHGNSDTKGVATGTETYYTRESSKALAEAVHEHLAPATGLKDRGVKYENFHVTRETTMPAILLETGFLSNPADAEVLFDDEVQNRIAEAIVAGIKQYLNLQ